MAREHRTIKDAEALKALAHPLRLDLLELLQVKGPRTATELAAELASSPSNCSWHLRKLAEHGFVEEVPGATGRARPWQVTGTGMSWDEADEEPETRAAGLSLTEVMLTRELQRLLAAQETLHLEPEQWRRAGTVVQSGTWMTAEEAREVSARMEELFLTFAERADDPAQRPEGARQVSLVGWLVPRPGPGERGAKEQQQGTGRSETDEGE